MTKKNFVTLILSTLGGILFAVGMCMCLLPQWNLFTQGIILAAIGAVVLLMMGMIRRKMSGKSILVKLGGKTVGTILLAIVATLTLGVGMCMTMIWEGLMLPGIIVGIVGILLLVCLIPLCKGIKN